MIYSGPEPLEYLKFVILPRRDQPKFKPKFTESQIREIVQCALRLKEIYPRKYILLVIKDYYKTNFPEEFKQHEKFKDWTTRCALNRHKIHYWMKKAEKDTECLNYKKELEIRKKTPVKCIKLTKNEPYLRHFLMFRTIFLEKQTRTPISDAIKEFVKDRHPEEYEKYQKFNDWHRCPIIRNTVKYWVKKLRKNQMLTPTMRQRISLSRLEKEDRGMFYMIQLDCPSENGSMSFKILCYFGLRTFFFILVNQNLGRP